MITATAIPIVALLLIFKGADSLKPISSYRLQSLENKNTDSKNIENLLDLIKLLNDAQNSRRISANRLAKAKNMYKSLVKQIPSAKLKKILRDQTETEVAEKPTGELQDVIENELKNALKTNPSALLQIPYVENQGRNDFLVMKPAQYDRFVTVIPNAIYYNIEKKCVNWLDDCSLRGIREKLLSRVHWPYK